MSTRAFDQHATPAPKRRPRFEHLLFLAGGISTKTRARLPKVPLAGLPPAGIAWSMCAVTLALTGLGLLLLVLSRAHYPGVPVFEQWVEDAVVAVSYSTVGAIVAPRFPSRNPIGWLFCGIGLVAGMLLFSGEYVSYSMLARPGSLPGGEIFAWISSWLWVPHVGLYACLGLLFPNGRLPTPRWRSFARLVSVMVLAGTVATALSPGPIGGFWAVYNPRGIQGAPNFSDPVEVLMFALVLVAAGSLLVRLRRARGVERQQIKWFAYAASVLAVGAVISYVVSDALDVWWLHWEVGFVGTVIGLAALPVALGIAIIKYRLHDIDLIINLTLVYGILTAVLAGIFEVTVVSLQHVLLATTHQEESQLAYFATALVMAALFEPLRRRIDAFVEGRFFRKNNEAGKPPEASANEPADEANPGAAAEEFSSMGARKEDHVHPEL